MFRALEQHVQEAQADHVRWLTTAQEKVAWCADVSGDKYAIEAKLATVNELSSAAPTGEEKVTVTTEKWNLLKAALPGAKKAEVDEKKSRTVTEWKTFVDMLTQAK